MTTDVLGAPAPVEHFGVSPGAVQRLYRLFESTPDLARVWVFGSRARGLHRPESDIDLAVDAPDFNENAFLTLKFQIEDMGLVYRTDVVWLQQALGPVFRRQIDQYRQLFWARVAAPKAAGRVNLPAIGTELKPFQETVLARMGDYLQELTQQAARALPALTALRAMEGTDDDLLRAAEDYPRKVWAALKARQLLPPAFEDLPHSSRFDGAGRAIPNVCLKVPTGGGKTLLAAASVARVFNTWFVRHTGLVLWVVPNDAIYQQTLKTLRNRDHPYRQILNTAGAGRVKILEKQSPLSRLDVDSHLCVMVLMLASAARQSKETLRFFRDRGSVLGFLPRDDDIQAHWALLQAVPNLDVYAPFGSSQAGARRQMGSIVKSSLGNVMRLLRPMVVIDEGHHGYTENALRTLDGFNPGFLLELSATPRVAATGKKAAAGPDQGSSSNILVDVRGTDLDDAQMIKLPIHVDVQHWSDWQSCLAAAVHRLDALQREAQALRGETARYIRPILLVQVERTGADLRDAGFIHSEDARAYLLQLGFNERQIAIKTADKDELKAPENIDLLSPLCEVRAIITKQALQEGWDCPFAYVLCALAAGRNPAAMTQLVGRILRQPQVTKTGRNALDACWVLCHDARTADVVKAIKASLESEGMGDLALSVTGSTLAAPADAAVCQVRRTELAQLRLFVPRVTAVAADGQRRELVYESDVLARVDWGDVHVGALAAGWAPNTDNPLAEQFDVDLSILRRAGLAKPPLSAGQGVRLDQARLVRALLDLVPNAWLVWSWIDAVVARLLARGWMEPVLAASSASLVECLRLDLDAERNRLAEAVFADEVEAGRIEFALRADAADYELPTEALLLAAKPRQHLIRDDGQSVAKSLLVPALRAADMNDFEARFAGYVDAKQAVQWWHRNVARTQYGLQGWRRYKVYPDFVFGMVSQGGVKKTVLLETKGAHLAGSDDTGYKQALMKRLSMAFRDQRFKSVGALELRIGYDEMVVCDLLVDQSWAGALEALLFAVPSA